MAHLCSSVFNGSNLFSVILWSKSLSFCWTIPSFLSYFGIHRYISLDFYSMRVNFKTIILLCNTCISSVRYTLLFFNYPWDCTSFSYLFAGKTLLFHWTVPLSDFRLRVNRYLLIGPYLIEKLIS